MPTHIELADMIHASPILFGRIRIRVLILTDDEGSFTRGHRFALTTLVDALRDLNNLTAEFTVTTAHRLRTTFFNPYPKDAEIQDFRFDNPAHFNPEEFDQVWLFGISSAVASKNSFPTVPLSASELRVLAMFMDGGGGVFATGDHEDLGGALCGQVPRVRSMRKWTFDADKAGRDFSGYDANGSDGPPVAGRFRHDTLVANDQAFSFDDQSDDVPGILYPVRFEFSNYVERGSYPHPLLCLPSGALQNYPDHMHEGHVITPRRLDEQFSFQAYVGDEYPAIAQGMRVSPQVIAYVETKEGHKTRLENKDVFGGKFGDTSLNTSVPDDTTQRLVFGAIGAYDGHYVNVGRVVVDSTFHHFVDVNLTGTGSNSPNSIKQQGFTASPSGMEHLNRFKNFYCNIGVWLARPQTQKAIFEAALWAARWDSQLKMQVPRLESGLRGWFDVIHYGYAVREALYRLHPQCFVRSWVIAAIDPAAILLPHDVYDDLNRPDPPPWDHNRTLVRHEDLITAMLAGMIAQLVKATPTHDEESRRRATEEMDVFIRQGAALGLQCMAGHFRESLEHTSRMLATADSIAEQLASTSSSARMNADDQETK